MSNTAIIEPSIPSLEPVEALRDEQDQLESWVHQSFSALEKLHTELNDWQKELTNQQAGLDQSKASLAKSQASLTKSEANEQKYAEQVDELRQELERYCEDLTQLEEENTVQSQDYDELESRHAAVVAELKTVREYTDQMVAAQEIQQGLATKQQRKWNSELKEMRQMLERQYELLVERLTNCSEQSQPEDEKSALSNRMKESSTADSDLSDDIRRRAKTRRAAQRRKRSESE